MKKQFIIFLLLTVPMFIGTNCKLFSQVPEIVWQDVIGGLSPDYVKGFESTDDGGYIIGGRTMSGIGADKTDPFYGGSLYGDYWVVKLDVDLNIEWQKDLGGSSDERAESLTKTSDGGYVIAGFSQSPVSGNKTEASTSEDYWVIKLNSAGAIVWQNTIGGIGPDEAYNVAIATDGNIIISGSSRSDISGDKTENSNGLDDIWMVKLNNTTGNIIGQNTIGGSGTEYCYAMDATSDGGCIIGASSNSNISGDKTMNTYGGFDYYIVKLNSIGAIEWQKSFGGIKHEYCRVIRQTNDGGYILAGETNSDISGIKTEPNLDNSELWDDLWVLKLDASGNLLWQNTIGGNNDEGVADLAELPNGGYLLTSSSYSDLSGDKTEENVGPYLLDTWVIRLDQNGNIVWQNTIGGDVNESGGIIAVESDGIAIAVSSGSSISGDKTIAPDGNSDFWFYKLESECGMGNEICNGYDDDCNGITDEDITENVTIYADEDIAFCSGDDVTLTAISTGPVQWKKNGVPIPGAVFTNYLVTVKGNYSCSTTTACGSDVSDIIPVTVYKNPTANITADGPINICSGETVTLTANAGGGLTYKWKKNGTTIAGATSINYTTSIPGKYTCEVNKTTTGCSTVSNTIKISIVCREGEEINVDGNDFTIYPNPNNGTFILSAQSVKSEGAHIQIYNSLGELIFSQQINSSDKNFSQTISLDNISTGIYFVRIDSYEANLFVIR